MALSLCILSVAVFAAKDNNIKIEKNGFQISKSVEKTIDMLVVQHNATDVSIVAAVQGYTLIKIHFIADCPGYYSTAMVLTIKIWDDGCVEFYPWYQPADLFCS